MKILINTFLVFLVACSYQPSYFSTASVYGMSDNEIEKNKKKALHGNSLASLKIGDYYAFVESKNNKAFAWYYLSAEQKNKEGMFKLADLARFHFKDSELAEYWYKKSIDYDPHLVNYYLGLISEENAKYSDAFKYYCVSSFYDAEMGPLTKIINLKLRLHEYEEALLWAKIKKEGVHPDSVSYEELTSLIDELSKKMTADYLNKSEGLVRFYYDKLILKDKKMCEGLNFNI